MITTLPLAVVDGVTARPCVRSGYCCKQGVCQFGEWDSAKNQCRHLLGDKPGEHACGIAEFIVECDGWDWSPAFGAGCCSPFNGDRLQLLKGKA